MGRGSADRGTPTASCDSIQSREPKIATPKPRMPDPGSFSVLGVRVHAVQIPDVIELVERCIAARSACRFIAFTGMHGITETQSVVQADPQLGGSGGPGWHALGVAGPLARLRNAPACLWTGTHGDLLPPDRAPLSTLFLRRRPGCCGLPGGDIEAAVRSALRRNLLSTLSTADRGGEGGSGPPHPGGGPGRRLGRLEHA